MTGHKSVLVIEPHFDGHHYVYLRRILCGAFERAMRVTVGVADDDQGAKTIAALERDFAERAPSIVSSRVPSPSRLPRPLNIASDELRHRRFLGELFERARASSAIDFVLLPYLDWSLFAISALGSPFGKVPFSGITMRQRFHFAECGIAGGDDPLNVVKGRLFHRLLTRRGLEHVFAIDETLVAHLEAKAVAGADKVVYFPDPSDPPAVVPRAEARRRLGLSANDCIVLIYGFLDARKGVQRLLDWMSDPRMPERGAILAVGSQGADASAIFASAPARRLAASGRLTILDGFVSEQLTTDAFAAADLVWLGYQRFEMMSGVLVKAAQHGRPVIHENYGLIGRFAQKYGVNDLPPECCAQVLACLPAGLRVRTFDSAPGNGAAQLPDHSWQNALSILLGPVH